MAVRSGGYRRCFTDARELLDCTSVVSKLKTSVVLERQPVVGVTGEALGKRARRLRAKGWSYGRLAKLYAVSRMAVYHAVTGKTWAHVVDPPPAKKTGMEKLTAEKVREARRLYSEGWAIKDLAERYGVTYSPVSLAIKRRTWAWVE